MSGGLRVVKNTFPEEEVAFDGPASHDLTMDARLAVLEQIAKDNRDTFREIKEDVRENRKTQTKIEVLLGGVATKGTVWAALGTGAGIAFAVLAVFIGILTYLQAFPRPT